MDNGGPGAARTTKKARTVARAWIIRDTMGRELLLRELQDSSGVELLKLDEWEGREGRQTRNERPIALFDRKAWAEVQALVTDVGEFGDAVELVGRFGPPRLKPHT